MARGPIKSIEERIAEQEEIVNKSQDKLKKEQDKLQQLYDKKDDRKKQELLDAVAASGKTYDEVLAMLNQEKEQDDQ